jgi:hypothetical protein
VKSYPKTKGYIKFLVLRLMGTLNARDSETAVQYAEGSDLFTWY